MKKGILLLLLMASVFAQGQSLKEALYSGKLKNQPGTVIRKGDDLASKMDTARTAPAADSAKAAVRTADATAAKTTAPMDLATMNRNSRDSAVAANTAVNSTAENSTTAASGSAAETATAATPEPAKPAAKPKDNNALWKEYMATVIDALKTEALSSKKVKKNTYYASVAYTIETDGQVTVGDVSLSPENEFLQNRIKEQIAQDAPRLNPVLNSTGTARKVTRRYNFSLTKE